MQRQPCGCSSTHTALYNQALVWMGSWQLLQELWQNLQSDCWKAVCSSVLQSWFVKALNQRQDHVLLLLRCCSSARWDTPLPTPEGPEEGSSTRSQPQVRQDLVNNSTWTGWSTRNSCGQVSFLYFTPFIWPGCFPLLSGNCPSWQQLWWFCRFSPFFSWWGPAFQTCEKVGKGCKGRHCRAWRSENTKYSADLTLGPTHGKWQG